MSEYTDNLSIISADNIKEIPDIRNYSDIIDAAKTGRLIIFVGAGVSKLVGLPLWKEFALIRLESVYKNGLIDFRTYEELKNLDSKKLLTICKMFLEKNNKKLEPAKGIFTINDKNIETYNKIYPSLYSIDAIYVTTNYDECLDKLVLKVEKGDIDNEELSNKADSMQNKSNREIIYNQTDLLESKLRNGNVIHIHGSIKDENKMIATVNDYLNYYGNLNNENHRELSIFLNKVFNTKYVVLFIGYGLDEYEILEYMLSKSVSPKSIKRHYMLYGCYKEDSQMVSLLRDYYLNFGVELIPYDISQKGYSQLIDVIENWSKILKEVSGGQDYIQFISTINDVAQEDDNTFSTDIKSVVDMIKKDDSLEKYLFLHIIDERWLEPLISYGFFEPEKVPKAIVTNNSYSIDIWAQTYFLIRLINNPKCNPNTINEILCIIEKISKYKNSDGNYIDNYHVWMDFVDILSKVPNQYISIELIKLIKAWTNSKFENHLVINDIGEKLLNKFLDSTDTNDIQKSELIIDFITDVNSAKKSLKIEDYYFKKIFNKECISKIALKCSNNLLTILKEKIEQLLHITNYKNIINYNNQEYLIKLIDNESGYIISIIKPTNKDLIEKTMLDKPITEDKVLLTFESKYCNGEEFVSKVIDKLYSTLGKDKLDINTPMIIKYLYYGLYNNGSYQSLYDPITEYESDPLILLINLFKEVLLIKTKNNNEGQAEINYLKDLLRSNYIVFKKVVLYIIGNNLEKLKNLFWDILDTDIGIFLFQENWFEDELRVVLENIGPFDEKQKSVLLHIIEKGPNEKFTDDIKDMEIKIWKQKRLNALSKEPDFKKLYLELKSETKIDAKLQPIIGKVEVTSKPNETPLDEVQLLNMTNIELSEFLSTFKPKNIWEGPSIEGLGKTLREFTKKHTNKIVSNINSFINTSYYYISEILYGIIDGWNEKQKFEWDKVFAFLDNYIKRQEFWNDKFKINDGIWNAGHEWVVDAAADLISAGTKDDRWAFDEQYIEGAKQILLYILDNIKNIKEEDNTDIIFHLINSIKGHALEALLNISLHIKRIDVRKGNITSNWDSDLETAFVDYLSNGISEAYTIMGFYLRQFMYLDSGWVKDQINKITFDSLNWEGFMMGYINSRTIYRETYILMKDHYKYAINHTFSEKGIKGELANHIAIGYLSGFEKDINYENYNEMICLWDYEMIEKVIWYFWAQRDELNNESGNIKQNEQRCQEVREDIIRFWITLYERYKNIKSEELKDEDKKIISDSLKLISILDEIDEQSYERIKFAISYAEYNFNSHEVIECLYDRIVDEDPLNKRTVIGKLLYELSKSCSPTYPKEKIIKLIEYLYEINDEDLRGIADNICNTYAKRNIYFLNDICLKHRNY